MNVFGRIAGYIASVFSPSAAPKNGQRVAASYDSAQTNRFNQNHWGAADYLSPNAANTVKVRHTLRSRSRYEAGSNSLYSGVLRTIADHTIGTGPRIEFLHDRPDVNRNLQELWQEWSDASKFGKKLWQAKLTQARDGEVFGLTIGNPGLESRVQLDYQVLEADYITSLRPVWTPWQVDGITYDPQWNPISYQVVTQRPNDILPIVWPQQHEVPANRVWHYFRAERPGQGRGVPELLSAFELLAVLRRYITASVSAAEVAASFAAFIKTQGPATQGFSGDSDSWLTLEIQRNLITMLPEGYDIQQLHPEQPTQSFTEFVKTLLTLLVRCVSMPLNIALCDSSGYNYSSGRLDHQTYFRAIEIDRSWIQLTVLARVLRDFMAEAELILGFARGSLRRIKHEWHWAKAVSIDPQKDAAAVREKLESFQISITDAQKQSGAAGDIIRETADYFGVPEAQVKKDAYAKIYGPKDAAPKDGKPPVSAPDDSAPAPAKTNQPPRGESRRDKAARRSTAGKETIACAATDSELHCRPGGSLELAAAEPGAADPNAIPKFTAVCYTGGLMWLDGHDEQVVIDLETVEPASPKLPVIFAHDDEQALGHAETLRIDQTGLYITLGYFSAANARRDEVVASAKTKYPWQMSVGGRAGSIEYVAAGESVTVNGRVFPGPCEVARNFRWRETSILTMGADALTSAELAARSKTCTAQPGASKMNGYEEWVRSMGFEPASLTTTQAQALENEWQSKQAQAQSEAAEDAEEEKADAEEEQDDKDAEAADSETEEDGPEQQEAKDERAAERADRSDARALRAKARAARALIHAKLGVKRDPAAIRANPRTNPRQPQRRSPRNVRATANQRRSRPNMRQIQRDIAQNVSAEMRRIDQIRAACGNDRELQCKALDENWSLEKVQLTVLQAERARGTVMGGPLAGAPGRPDYNAVVECSLLRRMNIAASALPKLDPRYTESVINAAEERENRGYSVSRIVHEYLAAHGRYSRAGGLDDETIRAAIHQSELDIRAEGGGFSTVSLSGILSNLLNKSLLQAFLAVPTASDQFCGAQDLNDFKLHTRYRMSMAGTLVKVGPTGELQDTTLGNEQWTNQLDTYGRTITLSRQMMINDDLNAFTDIPKMLGRQSALSIEEAVFTVLLANANASDGNAFFSAAHNNYQSGANSALGITGLTNAITQFLKQTDAQGKPIVLNPTALLVPPELLPLAEQLYKNQNLVALNVSTSGASKLVPAENPFMNRYRPVMSPYLSNAIVAGSSTTGWYLLADPADVPLISVGYLKGQRTPTIDQGVPDANILGFRYRCYFDFGIGAVDWRAGVFNAGV